MDTGRRRAARAVALILGAAVVLGLTVVSAAASITYHGTLHVLSAGGHRLYILERPGAHELTLHPRANVAGTLDALAGEDVALTGARHGNDVTVSGARATVARTATATATGQPASMKLAVLAVNFTDDRSQQYTTAQIRGFVFNNAKSAAHYWSESTGGRVSITGDVFGWYRLNISTADACNQLLAVMEQAKAAAAAAGINLGGYDHFQMWMPWSVTCGPWSGLGEVGNTNAGVQGTRTWIKSPPFWVGLEWAWPAHELGHNLYLNHSNAMNCGTVTLRVDWSNSCSLIEYGDPFDVMGAAWTNGGRTLTSLHRMQYGAVTPLVVTKPGTYTLAAAGAPNPGQTQAMQIDRGDGTALWLELRAPYGTFDTFAGSDPVAQGVSFRVTGVDGAGNLVSYLLDMTPTPTNNDFTDSSLRAGRSFTDPLTQRTITVNAVSATGATITVGVLPVRASVDSGVLNVVAGPGVNDIITAIRIASTGRYTVTDTANKIAPGNGCTAVTANQVSCAGATSIVVKGGDGNDTITVNAGTQNATLIGGGGNDTLNGGPEPDVFNGGGGDDTINSKDGRAENVVCKAGNDKVVADVNDILKDCETVTH
jgi:hypothetical protein